VEGPDNEQPEERSVVLFTGFQRPDRPDYPSVGESQHIQHSPANETDSDESYYTASDAATQSVQSFPAGQSVGSSVSTPMQLTRYGKFPQSKTPESPTFSIRIPRAASKYSP
jgi:hypothetical protein